MNKNPKISIIIPTFNSAQYIDSCLSSIKNQSYRNVEVIVVDQQSCDDTVKIAKRYNAKIISVPRPAFYSPPSKSRNIGAKAAKGEIFYHLDSDMEVTQHLLQEISDKISNGFSALIVYEEDITKGFWSKCKSLERLCYRGDENIESARAVRAEIFKKIGGYNESISSGEDFDIQRRYKEVCTVAFCTNLCHHNLVTLYFWRDIYKKYNYGKTASKYFTATKHSGTSIVIREIKDWIKNWRLLIAHPILTIGMICLRVSEITAGMFGYLRSEIKTPGTTRDTL